jgi:hypothetical protein
MGISDGTYTEVSSGSLHEGDPVVIAEATRAASAPAARPRGPGV